MAVNNEAYDLELFKPREPRLAAMENSKKAVADKHKHTRRQKAVNVVVYLTLAVILLCMLGYVLTCDVRLTELNKQISDCQTQLNTLQSERVRLEAALAGQTSAEQVSRYAQENGMYAANASQIFYVAGSEEDQVSVPREGTNWFTDLWETLTDFLS